MTALIKAGKRLNIKSFAVIPLSEVGEVRPVSVGKSAGVIGPLSGVLKADKQYRGLLNFIAGDTVLVESEGIAYILASEGFKTVTPDGEIFELGGRAFAFGLRDALSKVLEALEDIENVGEVQRRGQGAEGRDRQEEGADVSPRERGQDPHEGPRQEDRLGRRAEGGGGDRRQALQAVQGDAPLHQQRLRGTS